MESILQQKFNLIDLSQHFNGLVKRVSFSQLSLFLNLGILSSGTLPPPFPLSLSLFQALDEKFPTGLPSLWSINDKNGVVYGWPEDIRIQVVRKEYNVSRSKFAESDAWS